MFSTLKVNVYDNRVIVDLQALDPKIASRLRVDLLEFFSDYAHRHEYPPPPFPLPFAIPGNDGMMTYPAGDCGCAKPSQAVEIHVEGDSSRPATDAEIASYATFKLLNERNPGIDTTEGENAPQMCVEIQEGATVETISTSHGDAEIAVLKDLPVKKGAQREKDGKKCRTLPSKKSESLPLVEADTTKGRRKPHSEDTKHKMSVSRKINSVLDKERRTPGGLTEAQARLKLAQMLYTPEEIDRALARYFPKGRNE